MKYSADERILSSEKSKRISELLIIYYIVAISYILELGFDFLLFIFIDDMLVMFDLRLLIFLLEQL